MKSGLLTLALAFIWAATRSCALSSTPSTKPRAPLLAMSAGRGSCRSIAGEPSRGTTPPQSPRTKTWYSPSCTKHTSGSTAPLWSVAREGTPGEEKRGPHVGGGRSASEIDPAARAKRAESATFNPAV
eukprot:CAMPEP_0204179640 /NCGR_PEP_ID=MMETSP0361-20130328/50335_1 /ASSEMBLY_ACC=CAM_ASM_000343 /TAXON_ID=268821 /ORGANISM="Scrippsiella Hangoei, Strain SHTV-5" /LENGTH=127 /DNA_ID=CAMNT_0051138939 /DNA_START=148 /DNA_END=527 /DNA_ORIENTATION=-